jgi:hypothetical protein
MAGLPGLDRGARGVWRSEDADGELLRRRASHRAGNSGRGGRDRESSPAICRPSRRRRKSLATDGKVVELADVKAAKKAAREQKKRLKEKREGMLFLAEALRDHGRDSERAPGSRRSASGRRPGVRPSQLDADPFLINVANGTLVVRRNWSDAPAEAASWEVVNDIHSVQAARSGRPDHQAHAGRIRRGGRLSAL